MTFEWRLNGDIHRENGPAVIHDDGSKEWWVNDKPIYAYRFGEYMVIEDGLPCKIKWLGKRITQKKVLTATGIKFIPNLPGI